MNGALENISPPPHQKFLESKTIFDISNRARRKRRRGKSRENHKRQHHHHNLMLKAEKGHGEIIGKSCGWRRKKKSSCMRSAVD
jgi:hypothetical protein